VNPSNDEYVVSAEVAPSSCGRNDYILHVCVWRTSPSWSVFSDDGQMNELFFFFFHISLFRTQITS
jgi:hypothetical protein